MPFRDIDAALAERGIDPPTFRLGGITYTCKPDLPAVVAFRLRGASTMTVTEDLVAEFLDAVLTEDSSATFADEWKRGRIGVTAFTEVITYVMEAYTARPTSGPNGSSPPPPPTGLASTGGAPPGASTPST